MENDVYLTTNVYFDKNVIEKVIQKPKKIVCCKS